MRGTRGRAREIWIQAKRNLQLFGIWLKNNMKKLIISIVVTLLAVWISNAQTLPAEITKNLNTNHSGWKKAPGFCEAKKWFLTGDFDGNKQTDYVVRITTGKESPRLFLLAFLNNGGKYASMKIDEDAYSEDLLRSTFSIIKKGTTIDLGEGEGPKVTLKTDAVMQYICETDAGKTMVLTDGKWTNIFE